MKKRVKLNTYIKLILLISAISTLFLLLFLSLYIYTVRQEKEVYNSTLARYDIEIKTLFDFNSKTQIVAIYDITFWDSLVNFINNKDHEWFESHIVTEFESYEVDYIGIYTLDHELINKVSSSKIKSVDFIPKRVMDQLYKSKFKRFYMRIPEGIIEVFGATVHPSDDPKKIKHNPSGYFFMARLLDKAYFKNLQKICSSNVDFLEPSDLKNVEHSSIFSVLELKNSDDSEVSKLFFRRPFHINFERTKEILYIIITTTLFSIIGAIYFTRRWVYGPLKLITNILEKGAESTIYTLKREPGEFGYIGNLFEENNNQQKQLEISKKRAEESDKLKSSFLANLSHEIRTPMNAIVGFSDLLANPDLNEKDKIEFLKIIKDSGNSLVSIIEDLIEMSKIDANQITPNYRGINIEKCMEELYNTLKVTIPVDKNIDFYIIQNDEKITNTILTDEIKLKQIFVNLITNAIKFTNTGHVAFGYTVNHQKNVIEFRVEDSGVGINEGNLDMIFDRFRRIEDDYTIEFCGLGLGLSISKAYVEMLGGTIDVKSTIGIGSVFVFEIPLIYQESISMGNTLLPNPVFESPGSKTILIAEDDNINFLLLKKILELKNYIILRARNGQEAVDMCIEDGTIDVVFMDIKMPVLGGFEAFETVKNCRPNLPVIAQTAYSSSEDKEKIINCGFAAYITKPLDKTKIFEILDRIFSKRE